jgi:hypothetical protein
VIVEPFIHGLSVADSAICCHPRMMADILW